MLRQTARTGSLKIPRAMIIRQPSGVRTEAEYDLVQLRKRLLPAPVKDGDVDGIGDERDADYVTTELGEQWDEPGRLGIMNLPENCECSSAACNSILAGFARCSSFFNAVFKHCKMSKTHVTMSSPTACSLNCCILLPTILCFESIATESALVLFLLRLDSHIVPYAFRARRRRKIVSQFGPLSRQRSP